MLANTSCLIHLAFLLCCFGGVPGVWSALRRGNERKGAGAGDRRALDDAGTSIEQGLTISKVAPDSYRPDERHHIFHGWLRWPVNSLLHFLVLVRRRRGQGVQEQLRGRRRRRGRRSGR